MAAPCFNGPNPIDTPEKRIAVWKWAKENSIDQGRSFKEVADDINKEFFNGVGKPEWINDILSGRKTPFKQATDAMWKAQANRRAIIKQAQSLSQDHALGPIGRAIKNAWSGPRDVLTLGHAVAFPVSHGGDLVLRPTAWNSYFPWLLNTYKMAASPATHERLLTMMERDPLYRLGVDSGVDMGPKSHASGLISRVMGGSSERAWDGLTGMRFDLWKRRMNKLIEPGMSQEEILKTGRKMAVWANHATGSAKMPVPLLGEMMFGPKLTASKLARLTTDPLQTLGTLVNWKNADAGDKAVAKVRLSGAAQYTGMLFGSLLANGALNAAMRSGQQVNLTDPSKGDYLQFKGLGFVGGLPGLHSEIKTMASILAIARLNPQDRSLSPWQKKQAQQKTEAIATTLGQYALSKAAPPLQGAQEIATGQNWRGQPMPWSSQPGTLKNPKLDWWQYAITHGPMPLEGPAGYLYDTFKKGGASSLDATAWVKALTIAGVGATALKIKPEDSPSPHQQRMAQQLRGR